MQSPKRTCGSLNNCRLPHLGPSKRFLSTTTRPLDPMRCKIQVLGERDDRRMEPLSVAKDLRSSGDEGLRAAIGESQSGAAVAAIGESHPGLLWPPCPPWRSNRGPTRRGRDRPVRAQSRGAVRVSSAARLP
jgi:hypothetical protein